MTAPASFSSILFRLTRPMVIIGAGAVLFEGMVANKSAPNLARQSGAIPSGSRSMKHLVLKYAKELDVNSPEAFVVMVSRSFSAFSGGSLSQPRGAVLALPPDYYATVEPLDYIKFKASLAPDSWVAKNIDSFQPSEQGRRFTILHELSHLKHAHPLTHAVFQPLSAIATFELGRYAFLRASSVPMKVAAFVGAAAFGALVNGLARWSHELQADATAAMVDKDACLGGFDALDRHERIHAALVEGGESSSNAILSLKALSHPPLALRRWQLERILQRHNQQFTAAS